jgi:hypothetical protein
LNSIAKGIEIRNSYVNSYSVAFGIAGANDVSDINIHDNTVRGTLYSYPWFNGTNGLKYAGVERADWRIIKNVSLSISIGMKVHNVNNVTIEGNREVIADKRPGVELINVGGAVNIKRNEFINATTTYVAARSSAKIVCCSNKLAIMGSFDYPSVCR